MSLVRIKNFATILTASALAAVPAFAAPMTSMSNFLESTLSYVFFDFNKVSTTTFDVWMRILLWLFLFSVLDWAAGMVFKSKEGKPNKRVTSIVAFAIATISVFMIPTRLLLSIAQTYGIVAIFAFMALPILGLVFLMYKILPTSKETPCPTVKRNHIIRALIFYLLATIIANFQSAIAAGPGIAGLSAQVIASWHDWASMANLVCMLLMFYHLFVGLFMSCGDGEGVPGFVKSFFTVPKKDGGGNDGGNGGGNGGNRKEGKLPDPTPKKENTSDPKTDPSKVPSGVQIRPLSNSFPRAPKKQPIDNDKELLIDLSPDFNGIRSQDGLGACTAFAATSIFEYVLKKGFKFSADYLSPAYLWYMSRKLEGTETVDTGVYPEDVMTSMAKDGICMENLWKFEGDSTDKYKRTPDAQAQYDAITKKIGTMQALDPTDPDQWVHELSESNPLFFCIRVPSDFVVSYKGKLYDGTSTNIRGSHAMVLVGYHSHFPYKGKGIKAFKLRNSWGARWGENGYIWVPEDILKRLVIFEPIVISGWNKEFKKSKFQITGRAVFDHGDKRIESNKTGLQIFGDESLPAPDHPFVVGVIAQIGGKLRPLGNEVKVDPQSKGRFTIPFEGNPLEWEHMTELSHLPRFKGVDFNKMPAGVIVYKRSLDTKQDPNLYYHIVQMQYSQAGRGGYGSADESNKCSINYDEHLKVSGIPIQFTQKHEHEKNVIIPIFWYPGESNQDYQI